MLHKIPEQGRLIEDDMLDEQIRRRKLRAMSEHFTIENTGKAPIFSVFQVTSDSGREYRVIVRSLLERVNGCTCADFFTNTLGTCKHIEAVLKFLNEKYPVEFERRLKKPPAKARLYLAHGDNVCAVLTRRTNLGAKLGSLINRYFDGDGMFIGDIGRNFHQFYREYNLLPLSVQRNIEIEQELIQFVELERERIANQTGKLLLLEDIKSGKKSLEIGGDKLYEYQIHGALHLAFEGRAVLADELGIGKNVQAIAASLLLQKLRGIKKVLIIAPESLTLQWEKEIKSRTTLSENIISGSREQRNQKYENPAFFSIIHYEQVIYDPVIYESFQPDLLILDEAQRIKNWRSRIADSVKRIKSRYVFILTGTPIETRLDDLYALIQFVDPRILGPLWKFNAKYFILQKKGRGSYKILGHKNLDELRARISHTVLRRTKEQISSVLPDIIYNEYYVDTFRELRELKKIIIEQVSEADKHMVIFSMDSNILHEAEKLLRLLQIKYLFIPDVSTESKRCDSYWKDVSVILFCDRDMEKIEFPAPADFLMINLDFPVNPDVMKKRIEWMQGKGQNFPLNIINFLYKTVDKEISHVSFDDIHRETVTEDDMLFLRELSDNLLNLFPDRILLIRRAPEISEKQKKDKKLQSLKVLIVVDEIDPVLKDAIYSTAYSKGKQVQIVLFDRNGYASLAELFDSKLYESGKKRQQDEVYCSGQL